MRLLSMVAALSLAAASASFADPSQPSANKAAPAKDDPNAVICKDQQATGSRLPSHKICRTRHEWAQIQLQDRANLERAQSQTPYTAR